MKTILKSVLFLFLTIGLVCACNKDDEIITSTTKTKTFGIFKVLDDNLTVEMNGVINSKSLAKFNALYAAFPTVTTINIKECDGSMDDETNLKLSAKVHQLGLNTHLLDNGMIASGGVDFFLAGIKRSAGVKTKIGVHSWAGEDGNGKTFTATDFPVGHAYHLPYINYYITVGFTQKQAVDFYYFTINVATADSIHWMTKEEIKTYGMFIE